VYNTRIPALEHKMRIPNPISSDEYTSPEAGRVLRLLVMAGFSLSFGFSAWGAIFNNFAYEELGLAAEQVGYIQSLREIPGLLGFVLGYVVMLVPEMRLVGLCVALLGAGLLITGQATGFGVLLLGTMVMSIGFHFFDSANASLILTFARKEHAPKLLGTLASIGAVAAVTGNLAIVALAGSLGYRPLIYLLGGLTLAAGLFVSLLGRQEATVKVRRKVIFRRRYWLYYLLTFLMGSRRHIFTTFAIFLLVSVYRVSVQQTATLFLANSIITVFCYRLIGQLTARFGERAVLTANFVLLAMIFTGYAYITSLPVLVLFFIIDNALFGSSLAIRTYFQKMAVTQEEITSNVSMGQTINHLSAVFVPALGGVLWRLYGYQATFLAGTVIVLLSLVLTQWVRVERSAAPEMEPAGS
jgi:predicted MFS family arabinose efflux permease